MVAALSPADINYDETLSTLRYPASVLSFYSLSEVGNELVNELRDSSTVCNNGNVPAHTCLPPAMSFKYAGVQ